MALIQIVMGSASDKEAVVAAGIAAIFDAIGVSYALSVCSAHRNLPELDQLVKQTLEEGTQVFIGVAGMAAALPGALAGCTKMAKPILAVPLDEHGVDSCVYMPPGVPVLTTGVGKAGLKNAAIAAAQILGVGDQKIEAALRDYIKQNNKQPQLNISLEGASQ